MSKYLFIALVIFSNLCFADGASHGGRHEIAIDGCCGSLRHVHNWNNEENRKLFFDFQNHEKIFSASNSFSYVEYIDRSGKVLFHYPSPAYSKLWSHHDQIFVGMSDIMLYNPYQLVVWKRDGTILYKAHFSSTVAEFSSDKLIEFKSKHPQSYEFMKKFFFDYKGKKYCDFMYLGMPNQIGKEAWKFLHDTSKPHPYVSSSETTSNLVMWTGDREPEIDRENGNLIIYPHKGDPIVIELPR
ncbi:MAG: hypothetical protein CTY10_06940 [Methylotenera sp.]|nr:MAG: hypothetical protein CTY10_06940 [Methylotenera sp.]